MKVYYVPDNPEGDIEADVGREASLLRISITRQSNIFPAIYFPIDQVFSDGNSTHYK